MGFKNGEGGFEGKSFASWVSLCLEYYEDVLVHCLTLFWQGGRETSKCRGAYEVPLLVEALGGHRHEIFLGASLLVGKYEKCQWVCEEKFKSSNYGF